MDLEEKLIRKKTVYQGRYLRTEEHTVRLPDGKEALREIVSPPDAVGVLPIDQDQRVSLVRQYRPAIRQVTLEIPAGLLEPNEDRLETARRETIEEIGLVPKKLDFLFSYYHSVGFSTGKIAIYLGRDLEPSMEAHADAEEFLEIVTLPFEEVFQMGLSGKIVDSKTLLALLWYRQVFEGPLH
ncbi:MAG: NUDIX hydrolase [Nitrospira sp.]|nr:NUDIX hydrolase [Candidatus Manganitrophaceae bacterium]HIL35371.1 NUDIX hydrolase [Candidatus Manganitrophaceae bacterium]